MNSLDSWAVTKLDILTGMDKIKVCVAYEDGQRTYKNFPSDSRILSTCRPVYEALPGWTESLNGVQSWQDFPKAAQEYLQYIEHFTGVPVSIASVGASREQTIMLSV